MPNVVKQLKNKRESLYGTAMLIAGFMLWILIGFGALAALSSPKAVALLLVYVVYGIAIALFIWISSVLYRASAYGNMIMLSPAQLPHLHAMVEEASKKLGLKQTPTAFIFNSNGLFNAFARQILGRNFVFLTSALVEANDDPETKFIIGHEVGHHAAGHLRFWPHLIRLPGHMVPFLGSAYSRSREYTCDQLGAYVSRDFNASQGALQMLGCGCRRVKGELNGEAFLAQEKLVPPVSGFVAEIFRSHPRLTRRIAAIKRATHTAADFG